MWILARLLTPEVEIEKLLKPVYLIESIAKGKLLSIKQIRQYINTRAKYIGNLTIIRPALLKCRRFMDRLYYNPLAL